MRGRRGAWCGGVSRGSRCTAHWLWAATAGGFSWGKTMTLLMSLFFFFNFSLRIKSYLTLSFTCMAGT